MLEIIPVINCGDFECVKSRFEAMKSFGNEWAHIDISDGKFTPLATWNGPGELAQFLEVQPPMGRFTPPKIEVHLMVEDPRKFIKEWLAAGAKRIIIHLEAVKKIGEEKLPAIIEEVSETGAEVMLAINPATPAEELIPYLAYVYQFQCLAVSPGPAGQKFDERITDKVKFLRERAPDVLIEVDGGITLETAKLARRAGADALVSASYIFNDKNPERAYGNLLEVDEILDEESF